jgi:putative ABC transport system permease protein
MPEEQPASLGISDPSGKLSSPAGGYIAVRSALPPEQMIQTLRATVAEVDPFLGLQEVRPMTEAITNIEAPRRFNTGLISTFAVGALLLAMVGIYAVVAFSVSLRKQEIAIRMALGSLRGGIVQLVLTSAAKLTVVPDICTAFELMEKC